ncbi:hypothetical protein HGA34_01180 [Candidatus Falkowbacteria bacterium]|nr:hypothetical protein [Candidatus Falkowbacteria bacterium]
MPLSPYCSGNQVATPKPSCTCHLYSKSDELIHHTCPVCGPTHNGGTMRQSSNERGCSTCS